jgi:tetratricopeptide (TPR) repeat protein
MAAQINDHASQSHILNHLSYLQFQQGNFGRANEVAQQALDLATVAGLSPEIATGLFNKANALRNMGHYQPAIELYEQAVVIFEELDDQVRLADCLNRMGYALLRTSAFARAQSVMEPALAIRRRLDDRIGISYSLVNLAALYHAQGQFALMAGAAQEALAIAGAIGDPSGEDVALHDIGIAILEQGSPTEAISFFQRALEISRKIGDQAVEAINLSDLGRAYYYLGDVNRARKMLEQALDLMKTNGERWGIPEAHTYLAKTFLTMDEQDKALAHARTGLKAAEEMGDLFLFGITHRTMGEVAAYFGPHKIDIDPENYYVESIDTLQKIGAEAELARSLAAYGLYLQHSASVDKARQGATLLDEAKALFQKLDMARDLSQLKTEVTSHLSANQIKTRLPHVDAPTGRPLHDNEWVDVIWTVITPEDETISGKTTRRHHQLLRLLREAVGQAAAPTVSDLAAVLGIGERTVKRDLAALRAAGHEIQTRGSR